MIYLPFCIHNHQPAGNFDFVLEDAYKKAYWPFLKLLHEFPAMKMTLHNSGFLLDWLVKNHPEYIELLGEMVKRGQVEVMGGGFFEPILAVLPERDRIAQVEMMAGRIEELFGQRPGGLWLAERVWEPTLPTTLVKAGVEYVLVDDFHFIKAGLTSGALGGYYITEDCGNTVKVYPGSEALRYLIPFRPVEDLEAHLQGLKDRLGSGGAAIYGDDGEKFGVWPGTHKLVFKDGWLKRFFEMVTDMDGVEPVTLGGYAAAAAPLGRVYLPTCSYMEMGEWSLPPEAAREYHAVTESFEGHTREKGPARFMQGGTWRGFFAKYPESNWMHKRMLMASRLLEKKREEGKTAQEDLARAAAALYRAQCNDAFWHGIFGGLYLPHLRTEVYRSIIEAEGILSSDAIEGRAVETMDLDADGRDEVILRSGGTTLFLSPHSGGAAFELDDAGLGINAMNVLTRWPEAYHESMGKAGDPGSEGDGGAQSIHDSMRSKEKDIGRFLVVDGSRRGSLVEHVLPQGQTLEAFSRGGLVEAGGLGAAPCTLDVTDGGAVFSRTVSLGGGLVEVIKEVSPLGDGGFEVKSTLRSAGSREEGAGGEEGSGAEEAPPGEEGRGWYYGMELNILLPGCDGPRSSMEIGKGNGIVRRRGLKKAFEMDGVQGLTLADGHAGVVFRVKTDEAARLWTYPVYTVSLSEAGLERCFQGTCMMFLFPVGLGGGRPEEAFTLRFELAGEGRG